MKRAKYNAKVFVKEVGVEALFGLSKVAIYMCSVLGMPDREQRIFATGDWCDILKSLSRREQPAARDHHEPIRYRT